MLFDSIQLAGLTVARSLAVGLLLGSWSCGRAQDIHLESAGARFGFNPLGAGRDFHQAEGFVRWDLPWKWDLGHSWRLETRLETSAGWLGESGLDSAVFTIGPTIVVGRQHSPFSFDCGVSPTFLSRWDFGNKDFGTVFQFTAHGGINFDLTSRVRFSYRFQHMSNASISPHNPGLNLQVFGLSYVF